MKAILFSSILVSLALISGCVQTGGVPPAPTQLAIVSLTAHSTLAPTETITLTPAPTASPTDLPTPTATVTPLPTQTPTATPSPVPTYTLLRGKVIIDQAVCHYGPGAPYLYKYGVYKDSNLEIIARDEADVYVEIQAIGGNNPCWVKAKYLDIQGSLDQLQPIRTEDVPLPWSPYYDPPAAVSAQRSGDQVTVIWSPLQLRPGDDSEQIPYIIEAWVCQEGQLVFRPFGAYETALKITDEAGCAEPSHGRLLAAEKHGYTWPVTIPWPAYGATPTPRP